MSASKTRRVVPLSEVVTGIVRNFQKEGRLSVEEIAAHWKRLAGGEAAGHSWPRRLGRGRLLVEVENSGWMHALSIRRQWLLEGLVELLGAARVRQLSFRIGERQDG